MPHFPLHGRVVEQPEDWSDGEFEQKNNHSIVTRVDFGQSSFLFTGDLEEPGIKRLLDRHETPTLLDVDVYHVGHHGSHNGTTAELLGAVTPKIAVISVGHWDFGKPTTKKGKPIRTRAHQDHRLAVGRGDQQPGHNYQAGGVRCREEKEAVRRDA